jgi:hypothetical protein
MWWAFIFLFVFYLIIVFAMLGGLNPGLHVPGTILLSNIPSWPELFSDLEISAQHNGLPRAVRGRPNEEPISNKQST